MAGLEEDQVNLLSVLNRIGYNMLSTLFRAGIEVGHDELEIRTYPFPIYCKLSQSVEEREKKVENRTCRGVVNARCSG